MAKWKQWHPTLVWPWTSHFNFLCPSFFIWRWASLMYLPSVWSSKKYEKQFTSDGQGSNEEESRAESEKRFIFTWSRSDTWPSISLRGDDMTWGLEWSACGQTLALTFANPLIGGLRFLSTTGGTIIGPTLAGLFWGPNDPQCEVLSTEPSTQQMLAIGSGSDDLLLFTLALTR